MGPVIGAGWTSRPGRLDVGHANQPADQEATDWSAVHGDGAVREYSEEDTNVAAVSAYFTSIDTGEPLSERKLVAMFGKASRRWARNRMAEAHDSADAAMPTCR